MLTSLKNQRDLDYESYVLSTTNVASALRCRFQYLTCKQMQATRWREDFAKLLFRMLGSFIRLHHLAYASHFLRLVPL